MSEVDGQNEMFDGANVSKLEDGDILASLSAWARVFGVERETLRRRLVDAGVSSKGERRGFPVYGGRDVFTAWVSGPEARVDPDALTPFNRRAWYQGEHEKLKLQVERGELVPTLEVEQTLGKLAKLFAQGMDTLIDTVERDVGLSAPQARKMEQHIDRLRENLYREIVGQPDPAEDPGPKVQTSVPAAAREAPAASALESAVVFLREVLAGGARPTADLIAAAKEAGISQGTLRRAKAQLGEGVTARREGKGWVWSLEADETDKSLKSSKP